MKSLKKYYFWIGEFLFQKLKLKLKIVNYFQKQFKILYDFLYSNI